LGQINRTLGDEVAPHQLVHLPGLIGVKGPSNRALALVNALHSPLLRETMADRLS
jgi:hypothetical protein